MRPKTTTYEGFRDEDGVIVMADGRTLSPDASQRIVNHSPDGFEWGYGGSGPSQLALAILLDYTQDRKLSQRLYQNFKWTFTSRLPRNIQGVAWKITGEDIETFLQKETAPTGKEE